MESHFRVEPATTGVVAWPTGRQLVFRHDPFQPATVYTVRLDAGYRDLAGSVNTLNHGWTFRTEPAPAMVGSAPAARDSQVDPASVLSLTFSREMDMAAVARAVSITPSSRLTVRRDPVDGRRAVVAPAGLLAPNTVYSLAVTRDALDVDGNHLATGVTLTFTTGPARPLRHWVTVAAADAASPAGVFVVDDARLPRQLVSVGARQFSWSIDGTRILVQSPAGSWFATGVDGASEQLPFAADWAAFLAPGHGYVTLHDGDLDQVLPGGAQVAIATGVDEAAVDPSGTRVAYVGGAAGSEIWEYAVELRAHQRVQVEGGSVDALAWAPDASRLAYRLAGPDPARARVRVRAFDSRSDPVITAATGRVGAPAWDADSRHVIVAAQVSSGSQATRVFRLSALVNASAALAADQAIPSPVGLDIRSPALSPDGRQLAFISEVDGFAEAWLMNVDGTGAGPLTRYDAATFPYSVTALTWTRT